uniref:Sodium channel epithelial 1 subunit delta n=1 Tax=Canis lupus dingo TaxID=286419 RepID=A0A8C0KC35_CANLU
MCAGLSVAPGSRYFQTVHHPTYGSCYTFNGISATQHPGITHGISLVLRAEQQDQVPLLSTEASIKVMIHGRDHTPFLEHQGFSVRPGTETTIGIREVHRLGSPYSHCTRGAEGVDVQLLYNASYTLQTCLVSCFQQLMVETCSCGYYFYPLPSGAEYCSYTRHPGWGHCFYRLYGDLGTHRLACASRCPRPCRESSYKLSAGTSRWPSSKSAVSPLRSGPLTPLPCPRSHVAKVNIFYQELNYRTVDETPIYSVPQLLSAMGSLWSLWFGSSVLSVLELLELLLDAIALALLLGCRWLRRVQAPSPEAPVPKTHLCPPRICSPLAQPAPTPARQPAQGGLGCAPLGVPGAQGVAHARLPGPRPQPLRLPHHWTPQTLHPLKGGVKSGAATWPEGGSGEGTGWAAVRQVGCTHPPP